MSYLHVPDEVINFDLDSSNLHRVLQYLVEQNEAFHSELQTLRREHEQELQGVKQELGKVGKLEEDLQVCFSSLSQIDVVSVPST